MLNLHEMGLRPKERVMRPFIKLDTTNGGKPSQHFDIYRFHGNQINPQGAEESVFSYAASSVPRGDNQGTFSLDRHYRGYLRLGTQEANEVLREAPRVIEIVRFDSGIPDSDIPDSGRGEVLYMRASGRG